ncbi:MAG: PorP/SprF family type IX secretion system membrane protein [Bacteroidales bacterium]|jgi:type IX secretion system PorP/SprF family membrane protein|nr:PorP/SprF family type IX secretion system membrane protein [Bacteroidales bacterium]
MVQRKLYIFFILVGIVVLGYGQQEPQFTQYMYTILPINPGYAGQNGICASVHYRQQWAGFRDINPGTGEEFKTSPRDVVVSLHTPIKALHGGVGLTFYNEAYGFQNDIVVKLAYSFKMNIGGGNLGLGLSADMLSRKINKNYWNQVTGDLANGNGVDLTLIQNLGESDFYFDVSFGAYYTMQNKWYAGLSATQLISAIGGDKVEQKGARHVYAFGGYSFPLPSNPSWTLKPSALLKTDLKAMQLDLSLIADYEEFFWVGGSYRIIDAVAVIAGIKPFANSAVDALKGLEVVASYDITTSKMLNLGRAKTEKRSYGGYEFCIKYCFKIVTNPIVRGYKGTRLLGNKPIEY